MIVKWPMHFNVVLLDRRRVPVATGEPTLGVEQLHTMVDSRSAAGRQHIYNTPPQGSKQRNTRQLGADAHMMGGLYQ